MRAAAVLFQRRYVTDSIAEYTLYILHGVTVR